MGPVTLLLAVALGLLGLWALRSLYVALTSLRRTPLATRYDYIVVGAGTSGCVVAHRLTERPSGLSVLLLEAGHDDRETLVSKVRIPLLCTSLPKTHADWGYRTAMQPGLDNRRPDYPAGKVVGGTSAINWMLHARGTRGDYDEWGAMGCTGWGYESVLPDLIRTEAPHLGAAHDPYHTAPGLPPGPIPVTYPLPPGPLAWAFVQAAAAAGLSRTADYNGAAPCGAAIAQTTVSLDGARGSTAAGFLGPAALRRPTLAVRTVARVVRVLFDGTRAAGVVMRTDGGERTVLATKGVVLCAGAVGTPALLMASGVGPRDELASLGVPLVHDSPGVGRNLRDQVLVPLVHETRRGLTYDPCNVCTSAAMWQYAVGGKGPFRSPGIEAVAFLDTTLNPLNHTGPPVADAASPDTNGTPPSAPGRPDVSLSLCCAAGWRSGIGGRYGCPAGLFDRFPEALTVLVTLLRPKSVGRLIFEKGADGLEVTLDPQYLSDPADAATLQAVVANTVPAIVKEPPLCHLLTGRHSNDGAKAAGAAPTVPQTAMPGYGAVGTCAMCPMEGRPAVVDPVTLAVSGVEGLWVADCSVAPTPVSGGAAAVALLVGERAAAALLRSHHH